MASLVCINYQTELKRVKVYDGQNPEEFLQWKSNLRVALGAYKTELFKVLAGSTRLPRNRGERKQRQGKVVFDRVGEELSSVLFFSTAGLARVTVRQYEGRRGKG